jgi:hypothetical protein
MIDSGLKLALVARGSLSLAKYPTNNPDLYDTAIKILRKIEPGVPFFRG